MGNSMKDTFIHQYESQVAHAPLPLQLAETYSISSIIKDTTDKRSAQSAFYPEMLFFYVCWSPSTRI